MKKTTSTKFLLTIGGLGGLLYGIDFGVIAAAMPYLKTMGVFSDSQVSFIVGAVMLGGLIASLTAGQLSEMFGRRKVISAAAALFLAAVPVVCMSTQCFWLMYLGRTMQGMSAGFMSVVMPMYLTETLPPEIRGRGTGVFQLFLGIGLVGAAIAGFVVSGLYGAGDLPLAESAASIKEVAFRACFWWTLVPVAILSVGSLFLPESPVWLARRNGSAPAAKVETSTEPAAPKDSLYARKYVVPFLLALAVLTLNKTMGMSSITSYSVVIFQKAGFSGALGNIGDFAIKATNLLMTLVAAALVDRKGRTWLLKVGTSGMTVGLAAIGCVFLAIERFGVEATTTTGIITLGAFFVMQAFYALGPGVCVWLVLSELMPSRIRANGMSIALFSNQLTAWGLASTFLPWVNAWGWNSMFFFFAVNGALYFVVSCLIPETKGKSLDELEHLFDKRS
jgi:MFS family permease